MRNSIKKAAKLYEDFRDAAPRRVKRLTVDEMPEAVMSMGNVRDIGYDTTQGRKTVLYRHTFAPGSRPILATDGERLFILLGRFHVTDRGIVDLDAHGNEIDD